MVRIRQNMSLFIQLITNLGGILKIVIITCVLMALFGLSAFGPYFTVDIEENVTFYDFAPLPRAILYL